MRYRCRCLSIVYSTSNYSRAMAPLINWFGSRASTRSLSPGNKRMVGIGIPEAFELLSYNTRGYRSRPARLALHPMKLALHPLMTRTCTQRRIWIARRAKIFFLGKLLEGSEVSGFCYGSCPVKVRFSSENMPGGAPENNPLNDRDTPRFLPRMEGVATGPCWQARRTVQRLGALGGGIWTPGMRWNNHAPSCIAAV
jgi:hypothetical protein